MPTSVVTFFPIPSTVTGRRATTSTYTVPSSKFAEANLTSNGAIGIKVNATAVLEQTITANMIVKLDEGDTVQHNTTSTECSSVISEFDK